MNHSKSWLIAKISLPLVGLLKLVPWFTKNNAHTMARNESEKVSINFTNPVKGSTIKVIIQGQGVPGSIVDGGSCVNVMNKTTYDRLSITNWETCPFWLWMADTSMVWPIGLIGHLDIVIGGHTFQISAVVLHLDAPGAYPLLLGRPWLRTTNIKQDWQKNVLTFRKGKNRNLSFDTGEGNNNTRIDAFICWIRQYEHVRVHKWKDCAFHL